MRQPLSFCSSLAASPDIMRGKATTLWFTLRTCKAASNCAVQLKAWEKSSISGASPLLGAAAGIAVPPLAPVAGATARASASSNGLAAGAAAPASTSGDVTMPSTGSASAAASDGGVGAKRKRPIKKTDAPVAGEDGVIVIDGDEAEGDAGADGGGASACASAGAGAQRRRGRAPGSSMKIPEEIRARALAEHPVNAAVAAGRIAEYAPTHEDVEWGFYQYWVRACFHVTVPSTVPFACVFLRLPFAHPYCTTWPSGSHAWRSPCAACVPDALCP